MSERYYIYSKKLCGNDAVWRGPNNSGYTTNLDKAGIYTQEEIDADPSYYRSEGTIPIPCNEVRAESHIAVLRHKAEKLARFHANPANQRK